MLPRFNYRSILLEKKELFINLYRQISKMKLLTTITLILMISILIIGCTTVAEEEHHEEEKSVTHCGKHFPEGTLKEGAECPKGLTNDPYPGKCALYTDEDGNEVCDLSE
jgi:uncharacterized protein YceK